MNNSKIAIESIPQTPPDERLERTKNELSKTAEVIRRVANSDDWKDLCDLLLNGVVERLERQLISETSKKELDAPEIYRLQGQLLWAKRYTNLEGMADQLVKQVEGIKLKIYEEQSTGYGEPTSS